MHQTQPHSQSGQTLIEVLVTALVVALVAAAAATALVATAHASGNQRQRSSADALAAQDQDRMRGLTDDQLAALGGSGQSHTITQNGTVFTITSSTTSVTTSGQSSCSGAGAADWRITSTVSWGRTYNNSSDSVTMDSLVARPTTGDLLVTTTDQTGAALPGITVATTVVPTGGTAASGTTDANGCLTFAGLTAGAYTIKFSGAVNGDNYVDQTGNPAPTLSTTVTATGTPAQNTEQLGLAGSITASFGAAGPDNGTLNGDADYLSWVSTGNTTQAIQQSTSTAGTSSITTPVTLYPWDVSATSTPSYAGNYTVWGGRCAQQEPPTPNLTTVAVGPGGLGTPATVNEPELYVTTNGKTGAAAVPLAFKLTFASLTGSSCTDTWTPPVASGTMMPSTGWLQDPGQPYADGTTGKLTVCASYKVGSTTYYGSTVTTNKNFTAATPVTVTMNQSTPC